MNCHLNSLQHSVILTKGDLIWHQLCQESQATQNLSIVKVCRINYQDRVCPQILLFQKEYCCLEMSVACKLTHRHSHTHGAFRSFSSSKKAPASSHKSLGELLPQCLHYMRAVGFSRLVCGWNKCL